MFIIDFQSDDREALVHGFLKGLAAPVMIYHSEAAPKAVEVHYVEPEYVDTAADAARSDWLQVGRAITKAIEDESPKTKDDLQEA